MEIREEHIEWAIVDRLRTMLEHSSQDEFEITHAFALFSAICIWVRKRLGKYSSDSEWPNALDDLKVTITSQPWGLSNTAAFGNCSIIPFHGSDEIRLELPNCTAWQFFVWLRNEMSHADHQRIRPIHRSKAGDDTKKILTGFRFGTDKVYAELSGDDLRRLGIKLAMLFCRVFNEGNDFDQNAREGVLEKPN